MENLQEVLKRDGIAVLPVKKIAPMWILRDIARYSDSLVEDSALDVHLARERYQLGLSENRKPYLHWYLGRNSLPDVHPANPVAVFAGLSVFRSIAEKYFGGIEPHLSGFNVWHTFISKGEPEESQSFHRDPDDAFLLKGFLYLSDVDEESGPLEYVKGSHVNKAFIESFAPNRSTDAQVEQVFHRNFWVKAVGDSGTLVLADTTGLHKGGLCRTNERIVCWFMYTGRKLERASY